MVRKSFHGYHPRHSSPAAPELDGALYTTAFHKALRTVREKLELLRPFQRQIVVGAVAIVGLTVACKTAAHVHTLVQRRRRWQLLRRCEQDGELHIFILPRSPWSPSLSPVCTRVEAYLRAAGIPYKAVETIDPTGSPSGELPFIVYKHTRVDQLPHIFEFIGTEFSVTMDDTLTREERAIGAALRRTLEYSMERFLYRTVFIDHPALAVAQIARALNISHVRARMAVSRYAKKLHEQLAITAYGALISEQYEDEFLRECEALEAQIGDKRFLFSNSELTSYDCAVYAMLVPFAYMGKYTALSAAYLAVADSEVLMRYVTRISRHLFADVASRFDAAVTSFGASSASSLSWGEAGWSAADSEEVRRDVALSEVKTQQQGKPAEEGEPQPVQTWAVKSVPSIDAAAETKRKSLPRKASKVKKILSDSPPQKVKSPGASLKKP